MALTESDLIHDWNRAEGDDWLPARGRVELNDETLRDGLQSPSVRTPSLEVKVELLHRMAGLGIDSVNIGLPGAGEHVVRDVERLAREIVACRLPLVANCAARTLAADIQPIIERRAPWRRTSSRSSTSHSAPASRSRSPASSVRARFASTPSPGRWTSSYA